VRCGPKQGIFLDCPTFNTLNNLDEHHLNYDDTIVKCYVNLFNAESFGALNSVKPATLPSVLTCRKMLCLKFSDICNKTGRRIEKQPVKCSKGYGGETSGEINHET
jgi:hypothetical protein